MSYGLDVKIATRSSRRLPFLLFLPVLPACAVPFAYVVQCKIKTFIFFLKTFLFLVTVFVRMGRRLRGPKDLSGVRRRGGADG